jgi:hypothetical protein
MKTRKNSPQKLLIIHNQQFFSLPAWPGFYKRELWASKSEGAHSTKSLKISECER